MVKIKDFEQREGRIDISIPTIMSKEQHDILMKETKKDIKKAIKKKVEKPKKKYNRKIKKVEIPTTTIIAGVLQEKPADMETPIQMVSPDLIKKPVIVDSLDSDNILQSDRYNQNQEKSFVSVKDIQSPSKDFPDFNDVGLLKAEIKANKKLLKLKKKEEKLKRKLEKKLAKEKPKEQKQLQEQKSTNFPIPSFDEERAEKETEDVRLSSYGEISFRFCPSCNSKLKRKKVKKNSNVLIQSFRCKKCGFYKEVSFVI